MPLFDPSTGKVTDPEALRSVQFNGQGMTIPRTVVDRSRDVKFEEAIHSDTGETAGLHVRHGDGRVDAVATPPTIATQAVPTS